ncbi:hypothetical protein LUX01_06390 [Streptomyces sudanensis]|uniref:hypothetical protein n=1 Tax=Streptomyces sudanensis TaxID=436397 RepID=UPI0020CF30E8|nr:hypothetical protein [Streptomyces sudanensis]MCP9986379.1 hypothetical protein [Streptomyces sudanensis]
MISPALWSKAPATVQLYHHDPYATTATATVLAVEGVHAVFDRSIFYAESGGQVADQGTVDGLRVVDVQKAGAGPSSCPTGRSPRSGRCSATCSRSPAPSPWGRR